MRLEAARRQQPSNLVSRYEKPVQATPNVWLASWWNLTSQRNEDLLKNPIQPPVLRLSPTLRPPCTNTRRWFRGRWDGTQLDGNGHSQTHAQPG